MPELVCSFLIAIPISYLAVTSLIWFLERKYSWWFYFTHPKAQALGTFYNEDKVEKENKGE